MSVCVDYGDYDEVGVSSDCLISPLSTNDTHSPVFVTAFSSAHDESRDTVACSNGLTSPTRVYVISVNSVERAGDDVRRRLPRIRVNIVSSASSVPATSRSEGRLTHTPCIDKYPMYGSDITIVTQRRSVAKSVGCFQRRLFVCVFVSITCER